jgi:hypothetical protein
VANFFRQLGGALIVAVFGAILVGITAGRNKGTPELLGMTGNPAQLATAFRWVFVAASMGLALALAFLLKMEERPLRASTTKAADAAVAE